MSSVASLTDYAEWRRLCRQRFQCEADASAALTQFAARLRWWKPAAAVEPVKKHNHPGRPAKNAMPDVVGWHIQGELTLDEAAVAAETEWLGRFVLATNLLDEATLPDEQLLACYKEQSSSVERGFRFLKDPMLTLPKKASTINWFRNDAIRQHGLEEQAVARK